MIIYARRDLPRTYKSSTRPGFKAHSGFRRSTVSRTQPHRRKLTKKSIKILKSLGYKVKSTAAAVQ
jgi:hypothetical protein